MCRRSPDTWSVDDVVKHAIYVLKNEMKNPYSTVFDTKKGFLSKKNDHFGYVY